MLKSLRISRVLLVWFALFEFSCILTCAYTPIQGGEISDYESSGVSYRVHSFRDVDSFSSDFDDDSLQGWVQVLKSSMSGGPTEFHVSPMIESDSSTHLGPRSVASIPFVDRDSPHHTLVLRSPEFYIGTQTLIRFFLVGGEGVSSSPSENFETLPAQSSSSGFLGVTLRRVRDNAYVHFWRRSSNGNVWEEFNLGPSQLSSFVSFSLEDRFTIDLVDSFDGSWGWVAMDTFSVTSSVSVLSVSEKAIGVSFSLLIVGGGGPGGRSADRTGGGGGGGGVTTSSHIFSSGTYHATVGSGGTGTNNGRSSSLYHANMNQAVASALGGGRGGSSGFDPVGFATGGGSYHGTTIQVCPEGSSSRCGGAGFDGGETIFRYNAGGGGGAGGNGFSGTFDGPGEGGIGIASDLLDGTGRFYGGGGGGGGQNGGDVAAIPVAEGGDGGGGRGGIHGSSLCTSCLAGLPGEPNTGGGGGGASCEVMSCSSSTAASGGSGIVAIRYVYADPRLNSLSIVDADTSVVIPTDPPFSPSLSDVFYATVLSTTSAIRLTPDCMSPSCTIIVTPGSAISTNESIVVSLGERGSELIINLDSFGAPGSFAESYTIVVRRLLGLSKIDFVSVSLLRLSGALQLSPPFVPTLSTTYKTSVGSEYSTVFVTPWSGTDGNVLVASDLVVFLDASDLMSYPGSGSTWADLSGWNRHGTIESDVSFVDDSLPRFSFSGSSASFIRIFNVPFTGSSTASFSMGVWVRPLGTQGNIVLFSSVDPPDEWNMPPLSAEDSRFSGNLIPNERIYATSPYTIGEWYYIVIVWKYSSTSSERGQFFYVNGELQGSSIGANYSASGVNNVVSLARMNPGIENTGMFLGEIGLFQVYGQRALNQSEVMQNYLAYASRFHLRTSFMKINGEFILSGTSRSITLGGVGSVTKINVTGESDDETSFHSYGIQVKRKSNDAVLSFLELRMFPSGALISLTPTFELDSDHRFFSATVHSQIAEITVTPTCRDSFCNLFVNFLPATSGTNVLVSMPPEGVNIEVLIESISEDQSSAMFYTVAIRRQHGDSRLSHLFVRLLPELSTITLSPSFNMEQEQMMVGLVHPRYEAFSLVAFCNSPICFLEVNQVSLQSGQSLSIPLADVGEDIDVVINSTSEDGMSTRFYHVRVRKYLPPTFSIIPLLGMKTISNYLPLSTTLVQISVIDPPVLCSTQANLITNSDLDSLSVSIENKGPRTWILGTTTPILIESTGKMIKFSVVLCTFLLHGSIFIGVQPLKGAEIFVSVEDVTSSIQIV